MPILKKPSVDKISENDSMDSDRSARANHTRYLNSRYLLPCVHPSQLYDEFLLAFRAEWVIKWNVNSLEQYPMYCHILTKQNLIDFSLN